MSKTAKKFKSKWFRVAVEGATTDGRKIQRSWIEQMAKNYSPDVYGARINLEHIKGYSPDSQFKRYGDVLALRSEEIKDGILAGKLGLFAQIEPTDDLIKMNKSKQKVYLVGLAVTDDPASLGTEFLEFSANAKVNPLASRKQAPNNLFTAAEETLIEFENEESNDLAFGAMFDRLTNLFKNKFDKDASKFMQLGEIVEQFFTKSIERFDELESKITELTAELDTVKQQNSEYKELLCNIPDTPERPMSTGGSAEVETDC